MSKKVIVLGIDGLNPELVELWKGELPNISNMEESGMFGEVESSVPPNNVTAWTCVQTGRNPGAFGFWDYTYRDDYSYLHSKSVNSKAIKPAPLYKLLSNKGFKVASVSVPVTWPPPRIPGGYAISCLMAPGLEQGYTSPESLKNEVENIVGEYCLDICEPGADFRNMDKDTALERIYRMDEQRVTLLKHFYQEKQCEHIFTVLMGADRVSHLFYRFFDADHKKYVDDSPYKEAIKDYYKFIDKKVGEVREILDETTVLFVLSGHSVQRLDGRINLNEWLIKEGYMVLQQHPSQPTNLEKLEIDWSKTKAWSVGSMGQIYLNLKDREEKGIVGAEEYDSLLEELEKKLKAIPDENGNELKTQVLKRDDLHSGDYAKFGPDLFVLFDQCRWHTSDIVGSDSIYSFDSPENPDDGAHGYSGYFCAAGAEIPADGKYDGCSVLDIAPTVLTLMEERVPKEMEGTSLIASESSGDDEKKVYDRLKFMGY